MREDSPAARITPQKAVVSPHEGTIAKCCDVCQGDEMGNGRWRLPEGWQLDQIVVGNSFHRVSGLAPGTQAAGDYVDFESELL